MIAGEAESVKRAFDQFGRIAADDGGFREIFRHDGAGRYDSVAGYSTSGGDDGPFAYPHVVADDHLLIFSHPLLAERARWVGKLVVTVENEHVGSHHDIVADDEVVGELAVSANAAEIAHFNVCSFAEVGASVDV